MNQTFNIYLSGRAPNGCPWACLAPADSLLVNEFAAAQVCDLSGTSVYSVVSVTLTPPILTQARGHGEEASDV